MVGRKAFTSGLARNTPSMGRGGDCTQARYGGGCSAGCTEYTEPHTYGKDRFRVDMHFATGGATMVILTCIFVGAFITC